MKRLVFSGAAALLGLTGCTVESAVNDTDTIVVNGKALEEDQTPVKEQTLKLYRSSDSLCVLTDHYRDLKTDAQGGYSLELTGAETKSGDNARCFSLVIPARAEGAVASVRFLMQMTEIDIPDLQLWHGGLTTAQATGGGVDLSWTRLASAHGGTATAHMQLKAEGDPSAWEIGDATGPISLGAELLEDFEGLGAQLTSGGEVKGSGTTFHFTYVSDRVAIPKGSRVPESRGAQCQLGAREWTTGCPFTDGSLKATGTIEAAPDLRLTFDQPRTFKRLILRGLMTFGDVKLIVEASTDGGVNWTTVKQVEDLEGGGPHFLDLALDGAAPAADTLRIRVEGQGEPKIHTLRELSLFE